MVNSALTQNELYCKQWRARPIRLTFLVFMFSLFLYPIGSSEGLSLNYSFALFPVIALLFLGKRLTNLPNVMAAGLVLFTFILFVACIYQYDLYDLAIRRFVSFVLFITLFTFAFIRIDSQMVVAFKIAVVLMSAYFAISTITEFAVLSSIGPVGYEAKRLVGSQRYGFVYLFGFWIVLLYQPSSRIYLPIKFVTLFVLTAALFLSFSRSPIVALAGSLAIYLLFSVWQVLMRPKLKHVLKFSSVMIAICVSILLTYFYLPLTFRFYNDRLIKPISTGVLIANAVSRGGSEGKRVHIIETSLDFLLSNPATGTGYLGVWTLPSAESGSAHNQYLDVLLRVGWFGFVFYCYLIWRLLRYLAKLDRQLFWGLVGILIYGLFNETFKESQGAFVLAFLLGMLAQSIRDNTSRTNRTHYVITAEVGEP